MDWGNPGFFIAIFAVSYGAWLINNWIRAKHGYDLEDEWGGKSAKQDTAETKRLRAENSELKDQLEHVQDRMAVLERIVTDRGYSLSEEIEALRELPTVDKPAQNSDSGVPLNVSRKDVA